MAFGAGRIRNPAHLLVPIGVPAGCEPGPARHARYRADLLGASNRSELLVSAFREVRSVVQGELEFVSHRFQIEFCFRFFTLCGRGPVKAGAACKKLVKINLRGNEIDSQFAPCDSEIFIAGRASEIVVKTHISAFVTLHSTPPGVPFDLRHLESQYHELLD